jgi:hypothetical protein
MPTITSVASQKNARKRWNVIGLMVGGTGIEPVTPAV